MPRSANFSMTLHTEILSTETSDFLKQIFILVSFDPVFKMLALMISAELHNKLAVKHFSRHF